MRAEGPNPERSAEPGYEGVLAVADIDLLVKTEHGQRSKIRVNPVRFCLTSDSKLRGSPWTCSSRVPIYMEEVSTMLSTASEYLIIWLKGTKNMTRAGRDAS